VEGVQIIDVSPRDGLQIDPNIVQTTDKKELIEKLVSSGLNRVEVTSFTHPDKVPQMADAENLMDNVENLKGLKPTVLIPNMKGYERAKQFRNAELNWVSAASQVFNEKNIGTSIEKNMEQFLKVLHNAKKEGFQVCFSIAVAFGCPYEGEVDEGNLLEMIKQVKEAGVDRIGIADTIGIAIPSQVEKLTKKILHVAKETPVAIHLHDTRGLGLANAYSAYKSGINIFETSASGIGGCPFAPGSAGNLATEDLVYLFHRMGVRTGVNFESLLNAADKAANLSSKEPLGRIRHVENRKGRNNL